METKSTEATAKLAVIYTRVSSSKQKDEGTGLETQEKLCYERAKELGYTVIKVFSDAGISGKNVKDRPNMLSLLDFLKNTKEHVTIFTYHIDRLGRNTENNLEIIKIAQRYGHEIYVYRNGLLEDSPICHFMTTVQSAAAQLERENNAERSRTNMRKIMSEGHWLLKEPIGLKKCMEKNSNKFRWLLRKEPEATIIQEALNKFATAELETQTDVVNFLRTEYEIHGLKQHKNWFDTVKRILKEEKYTGYFEYKPWNIPFIKAHIEPLITVETFKIIQQRLKGKERVKHTVYNKNDERFPLRGLILCPFCHKPLTGSFSKSGTVPYYQCQTHGCINRKHVNVRPEVLHKHFEELLSCIVPTTTIIDRAYKISSNLYNNIKNKIELENCSKETRLKKIDDEINKAFEGYTNTRNEIFKQKYEQQVEELTKEKQLLITEIESFKNTTIIPFSEALQIVIDTLSNPVKIWKEANLQMKRALCDILFQEKPCYDKINKFQELKLTPIFKQIYSIGSEKISTIYDFCGHIVPNLKNFNEISILENTKFGTNDFPQIFKDFHKKVMGNSLLVP